MILKGRWVDMSNLIEDFPEYNNTVLKLIGNTPLIRLNKVTSHLPDSIQIYAKLEGVNPGGSIKDRPALQMILDGLRERKLTKDKVILDSTSGNTGIGLAMVGAVLGYAVELCVPANASMERKARLSAYGANVVYTDPLEGSDGAILKAREIFNANPNKYFKPDQYSNLSNPKAHMLSTGPEIWQQTEQKVSHFVASIGTTGTIMGVGRFLKKMNSAIEVHASEPDDAFHGLEGLKHMASSLVPEIYKPEELDGIIATPTDPAYEMARRLAHEEGLFLGQSSGGAAWAAIHLAERLVKQGVSEATIVTIFPDSGDKYYSKGLWTKT